MLSFRVPENLIIVESTEDLNKRNSRSFVGVVNVCCKSEIAQNAFPVNKADTPEDVIHLSMLSEAGERNQDRKW